MLGRVVGVLAALAIGATTLSAFGADVRTLQWTPVTTYVGGYPIGPEAGGVFYNVERDWNMIASAVSYTSLELVVPPVGSLQMFRVQTELGVTDVQTGVPVRSEWSYPAFVYSSPIGPVLHGGSEEKSRINAAYCRHRGYPCFRKQLENIK